MSPFIRRTPLRFSTITLACLATAPIAVAQTPAPLTQPTSVPIDLVSALVVTGGLGGTEEPRLLVGSAPEWVLPKLVLPHGARILGAAFQGTTVLAIVNVPGAGDSIIPELKAQLLARGWKAQPTQVNVSGGGFRPAPPAASGTAPTRVTVCDMPQALTVSVARRDEKSADIAYRITTLPVGYSACNLPQNNGIPGYKSPFPTLYNPQASTDARMSGDCQSSLIGSQGTNTTLRTALAPDLILDQYAKQLTDSGWSAAPASTTLSKTFSRNDGSGTVELSLTVSSSSRDQTCHDVGMNVKTVRKP